MAKLIPAGTAGGAALPAKAPFSVHEEPHPDADVARCGIVGYRLRDANGSIVAEAFPRAYPVRVDRHVFDRMAAVLNAS